jgi:hypothetical protein
MDETLLNFTFEFNLRRYTLASAPDAVPVSAPALNMSATRMSPALASVPGAAAGPGSRGGDTWLAGNRADPERTSTTGQTGIAGAYGRSVPALAPAPAPVPASAPSISDETWQAGNHADLGIAGAYGQPAGRSATTGRAAPVVHP